MNYNLVFSIGLVVSLIIIILIVAFPTSTLPSIPEGASVECDDGTGMVYRYTGGQLRYYPSPPIAESWNSTWSKDIYRLSAVECAPIPKGASMQMR